MIHHSFFLSSASYRVRIAIHLKNLDVEEVVYVLRDNEQRSPSYLAKNPQGLVPALETDDGLVISQSLAIINYLETIYPEPRLLPKDIVARTRALEIALSIGCDVHPLNNLRVLIYLENELGVDEAGRIRWYQHWVKTEFEALEKRLMRSSFTGTYCIGNSPSVADIFLVPQVFNARRFECDLSPYPLIIGIDKTCSQNEAFKKSLPSAPRMA